MKRKRAMDYKVNCNIDRELMQELEDAVRETGWEQADIMRACLKNSLPTIRKIPGLVPMLQPGVLDSRQNREDNGK